MKLTVVGINYSPELTGIGPYTTDMCHYFAQERHDVTMITGFPYYPSWQISDRFKGKLYANEETRGVKVKRCYIYVRQNITSKQRILHELSFLFTSFFRMLFSSRPDIYIVISPPLGLGMSAYIVSLLKMRPFGFHIQDLQPDAAVSLGMLREGFFTKLLFWVEKFVYRKAKWVSTINRSMKDRIITKGIPEEKLYVLPNWTNFEEKDFKSNGSSFRRQYGLENKFVFLYSGNIGQKQGLEDLIEAASNISDERIVFLIVGTGSYVSELKKKAEDLKTQNIIFLPLQPKEKLPEMLAAADVCLVIQKRVVSELVFPSKMTNIMAAGKPALVTADRESELAQTVIRSGCGFVSKPEDVVDLRKTILSAYRDESLKEKGENARQYALQNLDKRHVLQRFNQFVMRQRQRWWVGKDSDE